MCKKPSYVVGAVMVLVVALVMSIPLIGTAGELEPGAAPAPTMKTMDQIPPTWSQNLPGAQRFELVLGGAAVLDKETGLVWEQSPSATGLWWESAMSYCEGLAVGSRKGWHLPTVEQLASLVDPSIESPGPTLPSGHPFTNVQSSTYWSATTSPFDATFAMMVRFWDGYVAYPHEKIGANYVWCVRGGQSHDGY